MAILQQLTILDNNNATADFPADNNNSAFLNLKQTFQAEQKTIERKCSA